MPWISATGDGPRFENDDALRYHLQLSNAGIAQLVERNLAKVEVGSSRLLSRSRIARESRRSPS